MANRRRRSVTTTRQTVPGRIAPPTKTTIDNVLDPTSQLDRFEDKARREEARAMDKQQLGDSSLDLWFEQLESPRDMAEIEARLAVPRGA